MKSLKLSLLASALLATSPSAFAQDVGTTIYGSDGNSVGTVSEINNQVVVIDTGKHKAPVPVSLVFDGAKGKSVNATKGQIDMMMAERLAQAIAERDAALVQGASVVSAGGRAVGRLAQVDLGADTIMIETAEGLVKLKKEHFAVNPQGELAVLYSREQIASAAAGGKSAAARRGTR